MNSRPARIIFITACFVIPIGAILFVTRGDLSEAPTRLGRLVRGDDRTNLIVVSLMLFLLLSVLYLLIRSRQLIEAFADGSYAGTVLRIKPGKEAGRALEFMYGQGIAGKLFDSFQVMKVGLYARPDDPLVQPFLITGFLEEPEGYLHLLGHCAAMKKPAPSPATRYELILRSNFQPDETDIAARLVAGHTVRLYEKLSEEIAQLIPQQERRQNLILMGAQLGLWLVSEDHSLEDMRAALEPWDVKGEAFNLLLLIVLEALERANFELEHRRAPGDFLQSTRFPDTGLRNRADKLKRVLRIR